MSYRTLFFLAALLGALTALPTRGQARFEGSVSIWPGRAFATAPEPYAAIRLINTGQSAVAVAVYARYGMVEADSLGEETALVTLGSAGLLGDLTPQVVLCPERVTLAPGEERWVRYVVWGADALAEGGYTTLVHFRMSPPGDVEYADAVVVPLTLIVPGAAPTMRAKVLAANADTLSLLLTNTSRHPFVGRISIIEGGVTLGSVLHAVLTRERVDVPLDALPASKMVSLTFSNDTLPSPPPSPLQIFIPPSDR